MSFKPTKDRDQSHDPLWEAILVLYRQLQTLPPAWMKKHETPEHKELMKKIRDAVDEYKKLRGDEMFIVFLGCV